MTHYERFYSGKRRIIKGVIYYWRGWTTSTDYAVARAHSGAYCEFSYQRHIYGGRITDRPGWHIWTVSKRIPISDRPDGRMV